MEIHGSGAWGYLTEPPLQKLLNLTGWFHWNDRKPPLEVQREMDGPLRIGTLWGQQNWGVSAREIAPSVYFKQKSPR